MLYCGSHERPTEMQRIVGLKAAGGTAHDSAYLP